MKRVAVVGANGFIGSRVVETLHLTRQAEVRPIVRNFAGLVRSARFDMEYRIADARDEAQMRRVLDDCEIVVHAVAGSPKTILKSAAAVYRAADRAGVRRLVYLSSASVHGQSPEPGTTESTPLRDDQTIPYNNAKVRAERTLLQLRRNRTTEVVILRPGIVFGPRSFWITDFAERILRATACWLDQGRGICNTLYVDNLVHAITVAMTAPDVDGEAFLLGDRETVTWAELYLPIAAAFGLDGEQICEAQPPGIARVSWQQQLHALRRRPEVQKALRRVPNRLREALYALAFSGGSAASPWSLPGHTLPALSQEMALLYRCRIKLPFAKAVARLSYAPPVSFAEGCRRTVAWLAFADYPARQWVSG